MRILVLSDTHGDFNSMLRAVDAQKNAEVIIHCGDGKAQINCDFGAKYPDVQNVEVGGKKIFVTHGHLFQVKFTPYNLICAARENKADIVCFGHTHCAMNEYEDGLYIMNPGSCHGYCASYGYIDITDKGDIVTNIVRLDREV